MHFSTILTALFCPYIAHERTARNLDYVSLLVALFLTECHRSQNEGSLKSKERCAQLCYFDQSATNLLANVFLIAGCGFL